MSTSAQAAPHDFIEGVEFPTYCPIKLGYPNDLRAPRVVEGVRPEEIPRPEGSRRSR